MKNTNISIIRFRKLQRHRFSMWRTNGDMPLRYYAANAFEFQTTALDSNVRCSINTCLIYAWPPQLREYLQKILLQVRLERNMSGNRNCATRIVQVREIVFAARKPRHEISVNTRASKMAFPMLELSNSASYILRACFRIYPSERTEGSCFSVFARNN